MPLLSKISKGLVTYARINDLQQTCCTFPLTKRLELPYVSPIVNGEGGATIASKLKSKLNTWWQLEVLGRTLSVGPAALEPRLSQTWKLAPVLEDDERAIPTLLSARETGRSLQRLNEFWIAPPSAKWMVTCWRKPTCPRWHNSDEPVLVYMH